MLKYKLKEKGWVSQRFGENKALYAKLGLPGGHHGVDTVQGWGKPIRSDNPGLVYKVVQDAETNASQVHQLVHLGGEDYAEIAYVHLSEIYVRQGDIIPEGLLIGAEGNLGLVYSGGGQITPAMQDAGDRRGTHLHWQVRPVTRVIRQIKDRHYLRNADGTAYRDEEGSVFEIKYNDNGFKGCIDPMTYVYENSRAENMAMFFKIGTYILAQKITK